MNLLGIAWAWVSKKRNQATLAFIGGGLGAAIGGAWEANLHFFEKPKESSAVIFNFNGISAEQYEAELKRREREIRNELAQDLFQEPARNRSPHAEEAPRLLASPPPCLAPSFSNNRSNHRMKEKATRLLVALPHHGRC